jgi:hypothetical protein
MSVARNSATAGAGAPRRTYITMRPYFSDFFSYTTITSNYVTSGTLSTVVGASNTLGQPGYCAKGAFLRETGRRLYPTVNPGISTLMVGVYDFATGLTGFIDPNSFAFTPQNTDRSYYIDSAGYNPNESVSSILRSDQGPPVFTHGDMFADGDMYLGGNQSTMGNAFVRGNVSTMGNLAVGGNSLVSGNQSTIGNMYIQGNQSTIGNVNIGGSLAVKGDLKLFNPTTVGTTVMGPSTDQLWGGFQRHPVSNVNYNSTNSIVFLTPRGIGNSSERPMYSVEPISYTTSNGTLIPYAPSTFYIVGLQGTNSTFDITTFNYMIVNNA